MADIIHQLPDSVANQIAAGEVVKRPASVIKELVENSIDAGATRIDIIIKDGGRTLIQVVDNGKGMSTTDARMAFERHATSKITAAADLFTLHTMGFRGEALPSICAISHVEMRTRSREDSIGTRLIIAGSKVELQEPDVCDFGCNISVKNLFFNVPARRKFMKSDSVESGYILREFERMALVNNNVHFTIDTGTRRMELRPGNFRRRIADIWKNNLNDQLVGIDVETEIVKIHGYVSRPEFARRRNALQYMMANGRNMYHPRFHKAVLSAFDSLIAHDTQPNYFIKIEVDPGSIDVNIHPTKHEIKFEFEQQIWSILHAAVKASLGKNSAVPAIDFSNDTLPADAMRDSGRMPDVEIGFHSNGNYNPFSRTSAPQQKDWKDLYNNFMNPRNEIPSWRENISQDGQEFEITIESDDNSLPEISGLNDGRMNSICIHHPAGYVITTNREGLIVIDQYRAHLSILYNDFWNRLKNSEQLSQTVMFPETISLDARQAEILHEVEDNLRMIGFGWEYINDTALSLVSVPVIFQSSDIRDLFAGILDSVEDASVLHGKNGIGVDAMRSRVALSMCRRAAMKRNQNLTESEMEKLVADLFSLPDPSVTPDGNAVYKIIQLNKLF